MSTKNDVAWRRYLDAKGIVFDQPAYVVNADELKQITGREPRLLAKFDTPDQLPNPLRMAGYTLLPVRNGQYQLVRGDLFRDLPSCSDRREFSPQRPFPLVTEGRGHSESQFIDQAYNSGLLSSFLGLAEIYQTIRGREYTKRFSFQWAGSFLEVESVQIELDAGYEGLHDIVLVEAKIGTPSHFNIRQIYYPFRHFSALFPQKRVRTLFLCYDVATTTYHLYEYKFQHSDDPLSIYTEQCAIYRVIPPITLSVFQLIDARFRLITHTAPQADDLNKVYEILLIVEAGLMSADDIAYHFGFVTRQSSYYREAAEYLGLLASFQQGVYMLTEFGMELLSEPISSHPLFLAKAIINSWIFVELIHKAARSGSFTNTDIENIIGGLQKTNGSPLYTGSTISRRRQTIVAWIRWLAAEMGCFRIEGTTYHLQ